MGYRELRDGWQYNEGDTISGTRIFIDDPAGGSALPAYGDLWPGATAPGVFLRVTNVQHTHFGNPDDYLYKYVVSYTTNECASSATGAAPSSLPQNMNISAQFLSIDGKESSFKWADDSSQVDQTMHMRVIGGQYTITRFLTRYDLPSFIAFTGKVNSVAFMGGGAEFVMCEGFKCDEIRGVARKWKTEFQLSIHIAYGLEGTSQDGQLFGWNHVFRNRDALWVRTNPRLYNKTDLNNIFKLR